MSGSITDEEFDRNPPTYAQIRHFAQSPVVQFRHMPIAKNPYMSPYLAPDSLLAEMPPAYFQVCMNSTSILGQEEIVVFRIPDRPYVFSPTVKFLQIFGAVFPYNDLTT